MKQPQGFIDPQHPNHVCCLRRSLYGLKQAPRAWNHRLSQFLRQIGFSISTTDSSLFFLHTATYSIFLLVYVDDIILTGSPNAPISHILTQLQNEFDIKDLGDLHYFLGIEALPTSNGLLLHQAKFAHDIIQRANIISNSYPLSIKQRTSSLKVFPHLASPHFKTSLQSEATLQLAGGC